MVRSFLLGGESGSRSSFCQGLCKHERSGESAPFGVSPSAVLTLSLLEDGSGMNVPWNWRNLWCSFFGGTPCGRFGAVLKIIFWGGGRGERLSSWFDIEEVLERGDELVDADVRGSAETPFSDATPGI